MAKFKDIIITDLGQHALNEAITGHTKITFTKAVLASDDLASKTVQDVKALTTLDDQKETSVALLSSQNGAIVLSVTYDNDGLTKDIIFNSVGWYAITDSTEFLFAVSRYSQPQYLTAIPPDSDETQSITLQVSLAVGQGNVQVVQTQAGVAMKADLSRAIKDWDKQLTDIKADKSQVASDLAKKADQSSVDASVKSINDVLATKANSSDVSADLALKANQSDLDKTNATVAKKADTEAVNASLALKDDTADVDKKISNVSSSVSALSDTVTANKKATDTALGTKANVSDVADSLATKADKTDVASDVKLLQDSIGTKANQSDLDKTNATVATKADDSEVKNYAKSLQANIDTKANKSNVDSDIKTINDTLATKANSSDVNTALAGKANATDLAPLAKTADVNKKISDANNQEQADIGKINKALATKRDITDSYSKDELDKKFLQLSTDTGGKVDASQVATMIENKADKSDVTKQIGTVTDLVNTKANSSDVYTKSDVDYRTRGTIITDYDIASLTPTKENNNYRNRRLVDQNVLPKFAEQINQLKGRRTVDSPDFNNMTDAGTYYITNNAMKNIKNNPVYQWGVLIVSNGNGHRIIQVYYPDDGNPPWYRSRYEGTWLPWYQLSTRNDVGNANNAANAASNKVDTVLGNSYFRKQGMNANGDLVEIWGNGAKQSNGGYSFDIWSSDWTASKLKDVMNELPNKANSADVNNQLAGKANTGDVSALQGKVNVDTDLFRTISSANNWGDIFGKTGQFNALTSLRINPNNSGLVNSAYSAGIGFGGNDTKGVLSVDYSSHDAVIAGGNNSGNWSEHVAWQSNITNLQNQINSKANASDLASKANASDLAGYAKSTDLADYAKSTDVASKAQITDLQNQIAELKDNSFEVQTFKDEASGKAWEAQKAGHRLAIIQS